MNQRYAHRPHIYRARDDAAASNTSIYTLDGPIAFKEGERTSSLAEAQKKFLAVMEEHTSAMTTLFTAAHKNRRFDAIGPSRDNDAIIFEKKLASITTEIEEYKTNPALKFIGLYKQQEKRQNTINTALRDLRLYCQEAPRKLLNEKTAHAFTLRERDINAAHIDFCYNEFKNQPVAQKWEGNIRDRLTKEVIQKYLKRIPENVQRDVVNAFMDAVHSHPNFMAIYWHLRTLLNTDDDKMSLRNILIDLHDKNPRATMPLSQFAREGKRALEEGFKNKQAKKAAAKAAHRQKAAPTPIIAPVIKEEIAAKAEPSPAPQPIAPIKTAEPVIEQPIKPITGTPLTVIAKNPAWYQKLGRAVQKKIVVAATAAAATAAIVIAAFSFFTKPAPDAQTASVSTSKTTAANILAPAIPNIPVAQTPAAVSTAEFQVAKTPVALQTPASTFDVPLSDAPEVTAKDFPAAKPTPLQQAVKNTLATAPNAATSPSWAAQGTLGIDMSSLSATFTEQTQAQTQTTEPAKIKADDAKPKTPAPVKADTASQVQTAQTGEQISYLFAKLGGKKLQSVTYDEGKNTVEANFGNDYEQAFKIARAMFKSGKVNAKEVSIKNGVVTFTLK